MARSLPPLTWFRSFEAAARHLNFTTAADELGLTQSAVSQQIRALETRLGVQLFLRKARGLAITDDGRKLLPQVGSALAMLGAAAALFDTGPTAQLLTIATSVSVAQWILAPRIDGFLAGHPGLRLRFLSTIWPDEFKASIADVEIRFGAEHQVGQDAVRLGPDRLIAVAAAPITGPLADQVLIEAVGTSVGWKDWVEAKDRAEAEGITAVPAPTIYVDSYGLALDLAIQGKGIALTSSVLAARPLQAGSLRQVDPTEVESPEGYFLAVTRETGDAAVFRDWLLEEIG